jgi:hypothetical protein
LDRRCSPVDDLEVVRLRRRVAVMSRNELEQRVLDALLAQRRDHRAATRSSSAPDSAGITR